MSADEVDAWELEILADHPDWGVPGSGLSHRYFDRAGKPITFARWVAVMEKDPDSRIVHHTWLVCDTSIVLVSTVWLGMDHNFFSDSGPPLVFETMVFGLADDEYQERYATEDAARAGHDALVRDWLPSCREVSEDEARRLSEADDDVG